MIIHFLGRTAFASALALALSNRRHQQHWLSSAPISNMTSKLPRTMKAWQYTSASPTLAANLKLNTNAPLPDGATSLQADQVLVQVLATSLNPVDYKFPEIPVLGRLMTGSPATPGIDFAGRVAATGPALGTDTRQASSTSLEVGQLMYGRLPRLGLWLLFLTAAFSIIAWLRREHRLDKVEGPRGWPFIGIGITLPRGAPVIFREWGAKYGDLFKKRVGWYNWVVINSPDAFREILEKQVSIVLNEGCCTYMRKEWSMIPLFEGYDHVFKDPSSNGC